MKELSGKESIFIMPEQEYNKCVKKKAEDNV